MNIQTLLVYAAVAIALFFLYRKFFGKKNGGDGCDGCGGH